jgi:hypothetical protein
MSTYSQYPNLWIPADDPIHLFCVRVPTTIITLDRMQYWPLMAQRVEWMITEWSTADSPIATQALIAQTIQTLRPAQALPTLMGPDWPQHWAQTLINNCPEFTWRNEIGPEAFPSTILTPSMANYPAHLAIHTEVHLEMWLTELQRAI